MQRINGCTNFYNQKSKSFEVDQDSDLDRRLVYIQKMIQKKQQEKRINKIVLLQHEHQKNQHTLGSLQYSTLMSRRSSSNTSSPISTNSPEKNKVLNKEEKSNNFYASKTPVLVPTLQKNRFVDLIDQKNIDFRDNGDQNEKKFY